MFVDDFALGIQSPSENGNGTYSKYLSEEVIGHLNHLLTFGVWIPLGLQVVNPF